MIFINFVNTSDNPWIDASIVHPKWKITLISVYYGPRISTIWLIYEQSGCLNQKTYVDVVTEIVGKWPKNKFLPDKFKTFGKL